VLLLDWCRLWARSHRIWSGRASAAKQCRHPSLCRCASPPPRPLVRGAGQIPRSGDDRSAQRNRCPRKGQHLRLLAQLVRVCAKLGPGENTLARFIISKNLSWIRRSLVEGQHSFAKKCSRDYPGWHRPGWPRHTYAMGHCFSRPWFRCSRPRRGCMQDRNNSGGFRATVAEELFERLHRVGAWRNLTRPIFFRNGTPKSRSRSAGQSNRRI